MVVMLGTGVPCLAQPAASLSYAVRQPLQSAVHTAGPAAAEIARLWWFMFAAFSAVFLLVVVLLCLAVLARRKGVDADPPLGRNGFVISGGIILPVLVLLPILILSLETSSSLHRPAEALTVQVIGRQWWWEVHYPEQGIATANEIHIPSGQPVRLELTSADVIHSFWVPSLNGKRDMIPGIKNEFWIQAGTSGIFRGQCAEYCGTQHGRMAFNVVALPPEEFAEWVANCRQTRRPPENPKLQQGERVFMTAGCGKCHNIRGTEANGKLGPDLTFIGSRLTIGAGTLPNNHGNLSGWVSNAQAIKPGNKMPASYINANDLLAVVAYLESLE